MDYEEIRALVHSALKGMQIHLEADPSYENQMASDMQRNTIFSLVENAAKKEGRIQPTESLGQIGSGFVSQALWELVIQGILMPVNAAGTSGWPFVSFTEFGKEAILQEGEYTPYDPSGYMKRLREDVLNLDSVVDFYVVEALGSFRASRYTASTVMLGVSSERLFDLLQEAFIGSLASTQEKSRMEAAVKPKSIVYRYGELKKRLDPKIPQLPADLRADVDTYLTSIFNLIRYSRNDLGHPSPKTFDREEAYAHLYVFGRYCTYMYRLINHLANNPNSLT